MTDRPAATASPSGSPGRRTRLTPEREQELFRAVVDLVREQGYEALTMDAVAARTRSSKATLYRQWESKPKLVATALRHMARISPSCIDTGSLAEDLRQIAREAAKHAVEDNALLSGLAHAVTKDPELQQALYDLYIRPELETLDATMRRAVERGELDAGNPATEFVVHLLVGALGARRLVENKDADAEYLERYLRAIVFPALGIS
ncbi:MULTISPECIES: TetR/AcrR family transcriptional regulator [Streptomyces]|uniref:TetR/AcrR family transcriptional regulator n=1 Tax=Streptomyces desertarenae TaxID=2666184 RepID=A0ABW4PFA2_9ACTN